METKTNVMRILDAQRIKYTHYSYVPKPTLNGLDIAIVQGQNPCQVFKTLVTVSRSNKYYVFLIPVNAELDLKRAAHAVNEKSVDMLKMRDLFGLTGYVHGGCSPIGMKKMFMTVIDISAQNFETIIFSAGRVGHQIQMAVSDLQKIIPLHFQSVCMA